MCSSDAFQVFNNWSPFLVADRSKVWLGAEYFCYEGDELWTRSDESWQSSPPTSWRRSTSSSVRMCAMLWWSTWQRPTRIFRCLRSLPGSARLR